MISFNEQPTDTDIFDGSSSNWDALYCSHLWSNSNLRKTIINAPFTDTKVIKYCYTCKGKIRKYEVKSPRVEFSPNNHSTPNGKINLRDVESSTNEPQEKLNKINSFLLNNHNLNTVKDIDSTNVEPNQCIPSISQHIDSSFRQKFTSYEMRPNEINRRRLRKSLKGIGCVVNFSMTDSPVKKRTQIQACSISVMIVAIVAISFILVNFTSPRFTLANNVASTILVPTEKIDLKETSSSILVNEISSETTYSTENVVVGTLEYSATEKFATTKQSLISNIITKIRKNIRTYPKDYKNIPQSQKPKDIINRDLSPRFCSCQTNEVCMLDENTGTAICKVAVDEKDPTGCGGLCALETEACQLVDRARGVRVCRLLTLMTCSAHEWRCRNGLCVAAEARCDGSIQCYDRSDEMYCECDLTKQFRCGHSISCFPNMKICDGVIDCWDGFDELNCTAECPEDQFKCNDGQCILPSRFCDGLADCADESDEPRGCGGGCGALEMRCENRRCVPQGAICDGRDQCGDGSDELHCTS